MVRNTRHVLAIKMLTPGSGPGLRSPAPVSEPIERARTELRNISPSGTGDRALPDDISAVSEWLGVHVSGLVVRADYFFITR